MRPITVITLHHPNQKLLVQIMLLCFTTNITINQLSSTKTDIDSTKNDYFVFEKNQ